MVRACAKPDRLPRRPASFGIEDATRVERSRCADERIRLFTFGFQEAGRPFFVDVAATEAFCRDDVETLLYLVNSIRISKS